jgi:hypothetical protein
MDFYIGGLLVVNSEAHWPFCCALNNGLFDVSFALFIAMVNNNNIIIIIMIAPTIYK